MSPSRGPIAVTGAGGRLGRALLAAAPQDTLGWSRAEYDLDDRGRATHLLAAARPSLVVHAAAMTAVDEAARRPDLAQRRNADAVAELAEACRAVGAGLVLVSTNEVFDGERRDGRGYSEDDEPRPRNPYGASKLAGERAARAAFGSAHGLWVVRTAWLFGPPGHDFPDKIVSAADRLLPGESLPVVADEHGSPTYTLDLAAGILGLIKVTARGTFHLVGAGHTSRLGWARQVLAVRRPERSVHPISRTEFARDSDAPAWAVLDASHAAAVGVRMRPWGEALSEYLGGDAG
ncbi:dTDP-4-dehydrorhamnose reductase [soil metagenome]